MAISKGLRSGVAGAEFRIAADGGLQGSRRLDSAAELSIHLHPGGGATNPFGSFPGKRFTNAEVFGPRTVLKF
jgi:hypothetical protein